MDERYYYCSHLAWQIEPSTKTVFILDKRTNEMTIIEDSGRDIWLLISKESTLRDIIEKISISYTLKDSDHCSTCALSKYCTQCPGIALSEGNNSTSCSKICRKTAIARRLNYEAVN